MRRFLVMLSLIAVFCLFSGCASQQSNVMTDLDELNTTIRVASNYFNGNIPQGSRIAILNIQSDSPALSNYIIEELIGNAVNDRNFAVVDRQRLDQIRAEQIFQWSDEVDDRQALEIGRLSGAETILSGTVNQIGSTYRLSIRVLDVQSGEVRGQFNRNIPASAITALAGSSSSSRMVNSSDAEFRIGGGIYGGPILNPTDYGSGIVILVGEAGFGAFSGEMGWTIYPGANVQNLTVKNEGTIPTMFTLFNLGLNYTVFGQRWLISIGPGISISGTLEEQMFIPYAQAKFDWPILTLSGDLKIYLRAGYRLEFNNPGMAGLEIFNNYTGDNRLLNHAIFAGAVIMQLF